MVKMQLSIKNVEGEVFREFKAESVREGLEIGRSLTLAMKLWIDMHYRKPKMSMLNFKPRDWGKGTERLSGEIDKVLYA